MQMFLSPFAIMGFIFGLLAFTQVSAASARIAKLEARLAKAGIPEIEGEDGG